MDGLASDGPFGTDADCPLRQDAINLPGRPHGCGRLAPANRPKHDPGHQQERKDTR